MKPLKKIFTILLVLSTVIFYFTKASLANEQMYASNEKITPFLPESMATAEEDIPVERVKVTSVGKTMLLLLLLGGAGAGAAVGLSQKKEDKTTTTTTSTVDTGSVSVSW